MSVVLRFDLPSGEVLYAGERGEWCDERAAAHFDEPSLALSFLDERYLHSAQYAVIVTTEEVTAS